MIKRYRLKDTKEYVMPVTRAFRANPEDEESVNMTTVRVLDTEELKIVELEIVEDTFTAVDFMKMLEDQNDADKLRFFKKNGEQLGLALVLDRDFFPYITNKNPKTAQDEDHEEYQLFFKSEATDIKFVKMLLDFAGLLYYEPTALRVVVDEEE
jgi:hypothetical protein